mgnify:CR=1 FL=1
MKRALVATLALSSLVLTACDSSGSKNPNDGVYWTQSDYLVDTGETILDPNLELEINGRDCTLTDTRFKDVSKNCTLDFENGKIIFDDGTEETIDTHDSFVFRMSDGVGNKTNFTKKHGM